MSKKATITKYRWQVKTIGVNKTRSCACKFTCFFTSDSGIFFFLTFLKKWVGRAMENETFYGNGLSVGSPSEFGSDEIWWITPSYQWHRHGQSGFVSRNFRESPGQICIICHKQTSFQFFLIKCLYARMLVLFTF